MISRSLPVVLGLLASAPLFAAEAPELTKEQQKFSYALGFQIGQSLKQNAADIDVKALTQSIEDVLTGKPPRISMQEMQKSYESGQKKIRDKMSAAGDKNSKAGEDFLAANKKKPGVTTLPSGLQYKVMKAGTGKKPQATSTVTVHYRGTLINGKEFDSSYKRNEPTTFQLDRVIKGWQEALPLMPEGAKWQIFVPSELAYGARGAGSDIGPNETLIFEIELLKVN